MDHPDFSKVVNHSWSDNDFLQATSNFQSSVIAWSKRTLGNIFRQKNRILARLTGIQNSPSYPSIVFLQTLEQDLKAEFNHILNSEADYWKLRSHINWLRNGDANAKFFYISVINRRRKNKIVYFKDNNDNWITHPTEIHQHVFQFFTSSFTTSQCSTDWTHLKSSPLSFHNFDLSDLDRPLQDFEITQAIFSFKPFKAPGPDGFHPHFFQSQWTTIGPSVKAMCHEVFQTHLLPPSLNDTFLCLIPKFPNANQLRNF